MQQHLENPRAFSCDRQRQALITMETPCIRTLKHHEVFPVWLDSYIVSDTSYRFFLFKLHKFPPIRHLITSDWQWQCITQLGYSLCCWLLLKNSQLHRNRDHFLRIRDVTEQVFKTLGDLRDQVTALSFTSQCDGPIAGDITITIFAVFDVSVIATCMSPLTSV